MFGALAMGRMGLAKPATAPAYTGRGASFDGGDYYIGQAVSIPAGSQGLCSLWFRHPGPTWTASTRTIFEARLGATTALSMVISSTGRAGLRVNQDGSGSDAYTTPNNSFLVDLWYHVLWAWDYAAQRFQVYINGVALNTAIYSFAGSTKFDIAGATLTQFGVGALINATQPWIGDIAHLFLDVTSTLDLSVQANREKFAVSGRPVDLGGDGSLPLGTAPEWYFDGAPPAWSNRGMAGDVALTGALAPSSSAPTY